MRFLNILIFEYVFINRTNSLFTDDASSTGSRALCFNASSLPLLSASNNTKRNETVAVALFSTFNRPLSLRLGQSSSLYTYKVYFEIL
jgi:hypothetical protein